METKKIILITGGCRSGKSRFALKLAETINGEKTFIATAEALDDEMQERINRHRLRRDSNEWQTIEEPVDIARALNSLKNQQVIIIDCLTLWISNLLMKNDTLTEDDISLRIKEVMSAAGQTKSLIIIISNEVGLGIVPDNALSRKFRDLSGRANQVAASASDELIFMVSGHPLYLKQG
ncbi:MAG: bifunctional adenosylcobinamide kinase/adenosylcobinamide-phosphate guanylyltransferase [Spirochaetales bacterium]|nr:bifunctional adenosylcobinamide kinase/adenosylcobinamide-phosphate guanylyltransferase [Spirochaetales bacterium]